MNVFIFCRRNSKNKIVEIPFLEYLKKKYYHNGNLSTEAAKKIAHIDATIEHIVASGGKYNQPPTSEHYRNRKVGVMKIKEGKNLVRIAFWAKIGTQMVILNAKDKPRLYEKGKKRQVEKEIQKWLDEAERLLEELMQNPDNIIPYEL